MRRASRRDVEIPRERAPHALHQRPGVRPAARRPAEAARQLLPIKGVVGAFVERDGRQCRIGGRADGGGLRIDGGPDGFAERTVSLTDLAWVIVARDDVRKNGGRLDEQRVNRLRYLEGTPRAATRWIDTGWALALAAAVDTAGEG